MRPADDTEPDDAKRDPRDFALWKGAKPGEPAWETPWGPGGPAGTWNARPWPPSTWAPPSTSTAAAWTWSSRTTRTSSPSPGRPGDGFAQYWMHNGLVGVAGEKMSKSLGNSLLVDAMVTQVPPGGAALLPGQAHYRSAIEYSRGRAGRGGRRLPADRGLRARGRPRSAGQAAAGRGGGLPAASSPPRMDDDLGVPPALAVVHDTVRDGNNALAAGDTARPAALAAGPGHARRARPRPAGRALGVGQRRRMTTCTRWSTRWSRWRSTSGRRPASARTTRRPTRSGTTCRPPGIAHRGHPARARAGS